MGQKEPLTDESTSHTICTPHAAALRAEIVRLRASQAAASGQPDESDEGGGMRETLIYTEHLRRPRRLSRSLGETLAAIEQTARRVRALERTLRSAQRQAGRMLLETLAEALASPRTEE